MRTTPGGREQIRARLEAERDRVLRTSARLGDEHERFVEASIDSNADDEHDPEGTTIAYERAQIEALSREAATSLAEIDAAIARLADGSYGVCAQCGEPIPAERLEIRPAAVRCVVCADALANQGPPIPG